MEIYVLKVDCGCVRYNENDLRRDLVTLSDKNPRLKEILDTYDVEVEYEPMLDAGDGNYTIHPNGECGCIELDDEYLLGIRCNHLMWQNGYSEGCGMEDDGREYFAVIINGNHKGCWYCNLLKVYYEIDEE